MIANLDLPSYSPRGRSGDEAGTTTQQARAWKSMFDAFLLAHEGRTGVRYPPFSIAADHALHVAGRSPLGAASSFLAARGITLAQGDRADETGTDSVYGLVRHRQAILEYLVAAEGAADGGVPELASSGGRPRSRRLTLLRARNRHAF